jgi:hypothetical protein
MKKVLIILLTILVTSAFGQDTSFEPKYSTILNADKGERLLRQCSRSIPKKISSYWTPNEVDIRTLEKHFLKVKNVTATDCCLVNGSIQTLDNSAFQYVGVTIKKKKYIYINAFYADFNELKSLHDKWKTEPVVVCDGGDSYWGVLFDLDSLKFRDLAINGV